MLVGFFLPHLTWEAGPLVKFERASTQWPIFEDAWLKCWANPGESQLAIGTVP